MVSTTSTLSIWLDDSVKTRDMALAGRRNYEVGAASSKRGVYNTQAVYSFRLLLGQIISTQS